MKKFAFTAAALVAMSLPSFAADLPVRPPVAAPPVFSWTGLYVGGHAGWGSANVDLGLFYPPAIFGASPAQQFDRDDFIFGGQIGYRYQFGTWVLGIEASVTDGFGTQTRNGTDLWFGNLVGTQTSSIDPLVAFTGSVGYTFAPRWLAYVKGGWAVADSHITTDDNVPPDFGAAYRKRLNGWTAGLGVEWAFNNVISIGVEYNHYDLSGDGTFAVVGLTSGAFVGPASLNTDLTIDAVTARLNFKLFPITPF